MVLVVYVIDRTRSGGAPPVTIADRDKCAIRLRMGCKARYLQNALNPGALAAHKVICLVLLHSWPDTIHSALLRKTRISTRTLKGGYITNSPSAGYHPCYSGFQVQGTAASPAAQFVLYTRLQTFSISAFGAF